MYTTFIFIILSFNTIIIVLIIINIIINIQFTFFYIEIRIFSQRASKLLELLILILGLIKGINDNTESCNLNKQTLNLIYS